ncbi:MAG: nitroreductase/quinone reductase family protein [Candidatus Dormiibacterota bacterium]
MSDKNESSGRSAPQIPSDMKAFNQKLISEHRANHGQLTGDMAGRKVLLLTTIGARSGLPRTAVLGYGRSGENLVIIASNNGAPRDPLWYRNLVAHPTATVELGPDRFGVRARTAGPEERKELGAALPYLEQQQKLTERELPLVVLKKL